MKTKEKIKVKNLNISFSKTKILDNVLFTVNKNQIVSIMGPSGCGKSTLLHHIGGFLKIGEGEIIIDKKSIANVAENMRIVFQDYPLLNWKTLEQNVILSINHKNKRRKKEIAKKYLSLVGLNGYEKYYPCELSGGMAQRGALATAFAGKPELLLMDEPFGALDALTKKKMHKILLDIWEKNKTTIVMVTHDIEEAILLSDRIIILSEKPAKILKEYNIEFKRPRDENIVYTKEFTNLKKNIMKYFN